MQLKTAAHPQHHHSAPIATKTTNQTTKKCNVYLATEVKGRAYAEVTTNIPNSNKEFPALVQVNEDSQMPTQTFTQTNTYNKNTSQMQTKKSQNNIKQLETRNTFPTENRNITFTYLHSNTPNPQTPQYHRTVNQKQANTGTGYFIQIIPLIDTLLEKTQQTSEKQRTHELEQIKNLISALQQNTTI
ncbi:hypothetical protein CBL_05227 [Carabus blaptoides fortunei]